MPLPVYSSAKHVIKNDKIRVRSNFRLQISQLIGLVESYRPTSRYIVLKFSVNDTINYRLELLLGWLGCFAESQRERTIARWRSRWINGYPSASSNRGAEIGDTHCLWYPYDLKTNHACFVYARTTSLHFSLFKHTGVLSLSVTETGLQ